MSLNQHQQLYEAIQSSNTPLIAFKQEHNGDVIAASLALAELLRKMDKKATIVSPDFELPHSYQFLAQSNTIQSRLDNLKKLIISLDIIDGQHPEIDYKIEKNKMHIHVNPTNSNFSKQNISITDNHYNHDLIITVNTPDLESLSHVYEKNTDFFYNVPIVNIDHSPDNEHYGHINIINIASSSVSEIIYDFIEQTDANLLDETIATYLLTGMIEKTKSFKTPAITPKSLSIASQLMAAGAQRESIVKNLYQMQTVGALRLWGRVLLSLKTDDLQKIAWAEVNEQDFRETNALPQDLVGAIDELIASVPTIELTAIFYKKNEQAYCLLKSEKNLDLRVHFAALEPTGNRTLIKFPLNTGNEVVLEKLKQLL